MTVKKLTLDAIIGINKHNDDYLHFYSYFLSRQENEVPTKICSNTLLTSGLCTYYSRFMDKALSAEMGLILV